MTWPGRLAWAIVLGCVIVGGAVAGLWANHEGDGADHCPGGTWHSHPNDHGDTVTTHPAYDAMENGPGYSHCHPGKGTWGHTSDTSAPSITDSSDPPERSSEAAATPNPSPVPTMPDTVGPTPTATSTATVTPTPTSIPSPSPTPLPVPTPTPEAVTEIEVVPTAPTPTATPTATPQPLEWGQVAICARDIFGHGIQWWPWPWRLTSELLAGRCVWFTTQTQTQWGELIEAGEPNWQETP